MGRATEVQATFCDLLSVATHALVSTPTHDAASSRRAARYRPTIPSDRWSLVAADARMLGLRQAAKQHGVSHETVRRIVRRLQLPGL